MEDTEYKFDDIHVEVLIEKTPDMYNGNDLFCVLVNGDWAGDAPTLEAAQALATHALHKAIQSAQNIDESPEPETIPDLEPAPF